MKPLRSTEDIVFSSEREFVTSFASELPLLKGFWCQKFAFEFTHSSGRSDLIAVGPDGQLFAFEAKLEKWKQAVVQAYRNVSFCHFSFVLLPPEAARRARNTPDLFHQYGVGLCMYNGYSLETLIPSHRFDPIRPWLTKQAYRATVWSGKAKIS